MEQKKRKPTLSSPVKKGGGGSVSSKKAPNASDVLESIDKALTKKQQTGGCGCGGGAW